MTHLAFAAFNPLLATIAISKTNWLCKRQFNLTFVKMYQNDNNVNKVSVDIYD